MIPFAIFPALSSYYFSFCTKILYKLIYNIYTTMDRSYQALFSQPHALAVWNWVRCSAFHTRITIRLNHSIINLQNKKGPYIRYRGLGYILKSSMHAYEFASGKVDWMQLEYTYSVSLALRTTESKTLHTTGSKAWQNYMLSLSTYYMPGALLLKVLHLLTHFVFTTSQWGRYNYQISSSPLLSPTFFSISVIKMSF